MSTDARADSTVRHLIKLWDSITTPTVDFFFRQEFEYPVGSGFAFKRLYLCEMVDAIVEDDNIGHQFARKWVYETNVLEEVATNFAYGDMFEVDSSGEIYLAATYKFGISSDAILLSEVYGLPLMRRRLGKITFVDDQLKISWETLWSTSPKGPDLMEYLSTRGKR